MLGKDVKILQDKLINLNYRFNNWYEEGYFDDSTVAVVKQFQQKNGLKVTGRYDSTMRRYLWPTTVEIEEAIQQSFEGTIDDPYVGRTLKLGSYGEDVKAIQMKLLGSGYMTGNADGIYGALTKAAVKRFQKDYSALYGLKPDGVVSSFTAITGEDGEGLLSDCGYEAQYAPWTDGNVRDCFVAMLGTD